MHKAVSLVWCTYHDKFLVLFTVFDYYAVTVLFIRYEPQVDTFIVSFVYHVEFFPAFDLFILCGLAKVANEVSWGVYFPILNVFFFSLV
jgi:hypothetical protein